jgi:AraC-like DNA-binding protein
MADAACLDDACSIGWEDGIINARNCSTFIWNCCAVQSDDFALVDYATIQHDGAWHWARHHHRWHEVIAVDKGGMSAQLPTLLCQARAGDVLFYPANCDHEEWTDCSSPARTLCLSLQGPATLSEVLKPATHDLHGRVLQLLRWIEQESKSGLFSHPERVAVIIHCLVTEMAALAQPQLPDLVTCTLLYIHDHIGEDIDLDCLACNVSLSKFHFLREFRRLTGQTPMAELRRQRLEKARSLLMSTPWPLRVIAHEVGVKNEYHLSLLFRKYLGVSASQYRPTVGE